MGSAVLETELTSTLNSSSRLKRFNESVEAYCASFARIGTDRNARRNPPARPWRSLHAPPTGVLFSILAGDDSARKGKISRASLTFILRARAAPVRSRYFPVPWTGGAHRVAIPAHETTLRDRSEAPPRRHPRACCAQRHAWSGRPARGVPSQGRLSFQFHAIRELADRVAARSAAAVRHRRARSRPVRAGARRRR